MKIKTKDISYEELQHLPPYKHKLPPKQSLFFRKLIPLLSVGDLKKVHFSFSTENMEKIGKKEPCLFLMNHCSFIDLKIAFRLINPRPFHIVCTSDGFVGKEKLMRKIGCIPTNKFVTDVGLVRDLLYVSRKQKESILMYPEASYSFDGTATPLPEGIGKLIKLLGIPVVMIQTKGAFLRDPLYNNLQLRQTDVTAIMKCLYTKEDIENHTADEINEVLKKEFSFDYFKAQQEKHIRITEPFRADGLERVLYKCPNCMTEGSTKGSGELLTCSHCGKQYRLTEEGYMKALQGETEYPHIPDWYRYERECVKEEIMNGTYSMDIAVRIGIMKDMLHIYMVGEGRLQHTNEGFYLKGNDGMPEYKQLPTASYSLYADYFWYEIDDVICIGDNSTLYYCFPTETATVAKARLATEELYKLNKMKSINS